MMSDVDRIIQSRSKLVSDLDISYKREEEGGCGVIGFASTKQVEGKHLLKSLIQMDNRGNGKGGGVAILGLNADQLGIDQEVLDRNFILQIAYLDDRVQNELEQKYIFSKFEVDAHYDFQNIEDFQSIGLEVKPPRVHLYFIHAKENLLESFAKELAFDGGIDRVEEEFVFQNSFGLNREFYASLGDKRAFVLSHAKNTLVFKLVGYGHHVIQYYKLADFKAHIWIGHHRYPTKGTVWHPGGAHPFVGMNEVLVHNGDFSNYHSVCEYLAQRNLYPLFLTDTEISVYLFDLYSRIYNYPTEYIIEALAPTTERDFYMLDKSKQVIYRDIQHNHLHGSPDGPWFFIIGRSIYQEQMIQLLGITDTSMLRPQVFAIQSGEHDIALIGSERQAIDAILLSLSKSDECYTSKADRYWNARGGSYTDGGAFIFSVSLKDKPTLVVQDKFGNEITAKISTNMNDWLTSVEKLNGTSYLKKLHRDGISLHEIINDLRSSPFQSSGDKISAINELTYLLDNSHLIASMKSGRSKHIIHEAIFEIFRSFPNIENTESIGILVDSSTIGNLRSPIGKQKYLILDVKEFDSEGINSAAMAIVQAYQTGWKQVYSFDWRGQRFCGSGLGPNSYGFRIDVYGNPGDYLGSGLDGAEIYVHTAAQDQVGQMMKTGRLVIYGDVGQAFLYGAKGGEIFVLGNTAGRPLINAVGKPKVVINGTCLDYLAESFMAGDPLNDGGFAVVLGLEFDHNGEIQNLNTPYPGGNLLSLGSGGAIYIYDPNRQVEDNQLHGGQISVLSNLDDKLISKYLKINYDLFSIPYEDKLSDFKKIEPKNSDTVLK